MGGNLMNLLFLASEVNELEETFRELQEKYDEIYTYTRITLYLLITLIILKIISKSFQLAAYFEKQKTTRDMKNEITKLKEEIKELTNKIDNNQ